MTQPLKFAKRSEFFHSADYQVGSRELVEFAILLSEIAQQRRPVAQRLEQETHNFLVLGSNPGGPIV
jgi:hypothetical protein